MPFEEKCEKLYTPVCNADCAKGILQTLSKAICQTYMYLYQNGRAELFRWDFGTLFWEGKSGWSSSLVAICGYCVQNCTYYTVNMTTVENYV